MDFFEIIKALEYNLRDPLPGANAHEPMRAIPVGEVAPKFEHKIPPKQGSVLILLYMENGEIKFPLIKRPEYTGAHSGQISLPGGRAEAGEDVYQTALREAEEEIGIDRMKVNVLGRLSDFFVIPSNFVVAPVVAFLDQPPAFKADPFEVAGILYGEINKLISDQAVLQKEIVAAGIYRMMAPHFEIGGEIVWGATAMMLNEFRMILRKIMPP
jgi:8-oxo-dGTP pyrophosphatase MutT (NUDIX family)